MGQIRLGSSVEGAQHSPKGLEGFLRFCAESGASGAQPSNYHVTGKDGKIMSAAAVLAVRDKVCEELTAERRKIDRKAPAVTLDINGISCHCLTWIRGSAWTNTKTIRPFTPADVIRQSVAKIEEWADAQIEQVFNLAAGLNRLVVPMFFGVHHGWELATGYPWGMWSGSEKDLGDLAYDLIAEGDERFLNQTAKMRTVANALGIIMAHEIHRGTSAMNADDFLRLVKLTDNDPCVGVNADPSHCWENEDWFTRFMKVAAYVFGVHLKNHHVRNGFPLSGMEPNWTKRAMEFTDLASGDINLVRFVELMLDVGYPQRWLSKSKGAEVVPLVAEAESGHQDLDTTARNAVVYTNENLLLVPAEGSFEDGMGAAA